MTGQIDMFVGARICLRRLRLGLSQSELAGALGVSCEQLQSFERGRNRIGAGALRRAAEALRVSVSYFYDQAPSPVSPPQIGDTLSALERDLLTNFRAIEDEALRNTVVHLLASITNTAPRSGQRLRVRAARSGSPNNAR